MLLILLLFGPVAVWSQGASDCIDAITVCGNSRISSNASGFGVQELDATSNPCTFEESNSLWLRMNIGQSGDLEFTITPVNNSIGVDYDFYIFGPDFSCGNTNAPIRCSTTNPQQAGLGSNTTGLRSNESDTSEGPGELGNSFVSSLPVLAGETYYLMIDRPIGNGGFDLDWKGTADFVEQPIITGEPDPIALCFTQIGAPVDLTQNQDQIATGDSLQFEYYSTLANAFDGTDAIGDPSSFPIDAVTSIFVKTIGPDTCFDITEQPILMDPPITKTFEYVACDPDEDGSESFQISQIIADVQNSIASPINYSVTVHPTPADATNGTNAIATATYEAPDGTLYARVIWTPDPSCFDVVDVNLRVVPSPIRVPDELVQCDVDLANELDGITAFNLDQLFANIEATNFLYLFYETEQDRDNNDPIADFSNFTNSTPVNQTIYYRVLTDVCETLGEVLLTVNPAPVRTSVQSPLIVCDEDPEDDALTGNFDLNLFGQNSYPGSETAFYATLEDAKLEQNPLSDSYLSEDTTVYVRIEENNDCEGIEVVELLVNPLPEISFNGSFFICTDNPVLSLEAPPGYDGYLWTALDTNGPAEISNQRTATFDSPGNYRLTVSQTFVNSGQTISCSNDADFTIAPSNAAVIERIDLTDASDNNTVAIIVNGAGDYEYSIDGEEYQDANFFANIPPGTLELYIRDKNGCGITEETITVLGYPKVFTPNGDGIGDFWQLIGVDPSVEQNTTISIYDRYGTLINRFRADENGWSGNANGRPIPPSDYWFVANIDGEREFKGHFTLKR